MIYARCLPTELLLEQKSPRLSHAERLRVEAHLAECGRCRREHGAMLNLLRAVDERIESAVKPQVQERAIARALLRSQQEHGRELVSGAASGGLRRLSWAVGAALCLALAGAGLWWRAQEVTGAATAIATATQRAAVAGSLLSGMVSLNGVKLATGEALPADRELQPTGPFVLQLAHARLSAEHADAIQWSPTRRAVTLRGAVVDVSVDPSRREPFRIVTPRFIVDVVGTEFRVARDTVTVTRGRVRVVTAGGVLLAELGPNQTWTYLAAQNASDREGMSQPVAKSTPEPSAQLRRAEPAGRDKLAELAPSAAASQSAAELLQRARQRLAGGDARGALSDLDAALRAGASRSQQAEAYMLKADCALVQGNTRAAVQQYLEVSRRFSGLRAGETALFSAARTESNGGNKAAAAKLLKTYRERYPAGQFKTEVDARLRLLEAP